MTIYASLQGERWVQLRADLTPDDLAEWHAVEVVIDAKPEGGYWLVASSLYDLGGVPHLATEWEPWTLYGATTRKKALLGAMFKQRLLGGFPCTLEGVEETLQTRDEDKVNWLTYYVFCAGQAAGGGGEVLMGLPVRTTSNRTYTLTANQGVTLMVSLQTWYAGQMAYNWELEGLIDGVMSDEVEVAQSALDAIDVEAGWPG